MSESQVSESEMSLDRIDEMGEATFELLVEDIEQLSPRRIMAYGAGRSSVRLALAFPRSHVLVVEHDDPSFFGARALHKKFPKLFNLDIDPRALKWQRFHGALFQTYAPGDIPRVLDVAILQAPPVGHLGGREACLYQVWDRLRVGGRVYLFGNDFKTLNNWLARYEEDPEGCVHFLEGDQRVIVFEKRREHDGRGAQRMLNLENALEVSRRTTRKVLRKLRGR